MTMSLKPFAERWSTRWPTDGLLRRGMLGFGRSKVNGLSLVPVPPHIMHAFIDVPHLLRFVVRVLEFTLGVVNFMIKRCL
jgi:hypothetical protein